MKVLHYSLGFPPVRRGGMTAYCMDLMDAQVMAGDDVALMWPGSLKSKSPRCSIKRRPNYTLPSGNQCKSFSIENSLPVPLVDGIADPSWQFQRKDQSVFNRFYEDGGFDVLHLHTIMGMPVELVKAAQDNDVPVVLTTHDYFALCGKLTLFRDGDVCDDDDHCRKCCACNAGGLAVGKMRVLQSPMYGILKETPIVKALRSRHNEHVDDFVINNLKQPVVDDRKAEQYAKLRDRNVSLINSLDGIIFNSGLSKEIYHRYGVSNAFETIMHVTNSEITDCRHVVKASGRVRFGYMGGPTVHKGRQILIGACDSLWNAGCRDFELHTFGNFDVKRPYAITHMPFCKGELAIAMNYVDVAVVPSTCYETYGFVASEAMSFGRPVIISTRVGARDLVEDGLNGRIVAPDVASLASAMKSLIANPEIIERYSKWICKNTTPLTIKQHGERIHQFYRTVLQQSHEQGENREG